MTLFTPYLFIYFLHVLQQFEVLKVHTDLLVEEYYGAKGVDQWNANSWAKEINEHDVSWILSSSSSFHTSNIIYVDNFH